ncbi:MAG: hypothetical protein UX39_C0012G0002 [Candidatus Magasanikbacteria bacterium GW2011_GWA2_46_17]|uniref:Uncharacterized protein n=1 Tax=Candidatus Magasanikbacteria bacterium GW2011_GWA2_46_17 TaxID=1619042 RepID=A0A0G1RYX2_9BACT|nr:MAG: hypothetical protein UX39_C0012G0002 [Candidatus Magasanikbacteria bacterium GW2011_GWA2_46_17]
MTLVILRIVATSCLDALMLKKPFVLSKLPPKIDYNQLIKQNC